jgi:oxygen-independent coproporphyrinogen-3 oxidase
VPPKSRHIIDDYVATLEREVRFWGERFDFKHRPVTTVHFGGGSPLVLTASQMCRLLRTLKEYYSIDTNTEIAVEITTSQVTPENIELFRENNIHRVHIGVQTLSNPIRKIIGRRESAETVRKKIELIRKEKFIISLDMLYGLPLQTLESFMGGLEDCIGEGMDGFALYELQISRALDRVIQKNPDYQPQKANSYRMLMEGKKLLNGAGYENVFFNHYGNERDKNLYFTFPERGEDCIAFGAIADGQIGSALFRHETYKPYTESVGQGKAGIDFGYMELDGRAQVKKFENDLMSTAVPAASVDHMRNLLGEPFKRTLDIWEESRLIEPANDKGDFRLTGSGCWLLSTMVGELRELAL